MKANEKLYRMDRESRAERALTQYHNIGKECKDDIIYSIKNSKIYSPNFVPTVKAKKVNTVYRLVDRDAVAAAIENGNAISRANRQTALLNFGSYLRPGGGFLNGLISQEESICHETFLYNVLVNLKTYYAKNAGSENNGYYWNRAIFTPDIKFTRFDVDKWCHVITCTPPNKRKAKEYEDYKDKENLWMLRDRIRFILDIARDNGVKNLILGAFGCGTYMQSAQDVAILFKELLENYGCFEEVVFAIPRASNGHYETFHRVFKDKLRK